MCKRGTPIDLLDTKEHWMAASYSVVSCFLTAGCFLGTSTRLQSKRSTSGGTRHVARTYVDVACDLWAWSMINNLCYRKGDIHNQEDSSCSCFFDLILKKPNCARFMPSRIISYRPPHHLRKVIYTLAVQNHFRSSFFLVRL